MGELVWGYPIIFHLFLVSLAAGVLAISTYLILWRGDDAAVFVLARYGAFLAPIPIILDGLVLILDLGSFRAGYWFKFLNLYKTVNGSPMSIGTWMITVFIAISLLYAYTFLRRMSAGSDNSRTGQHRGLVWAGLAVALMVAAYPGFLLSGMQARPFWNSPLVPLVFFLSALVLGIACMLFFAAWHGRQVLDTKGHGNENGLFTWLAHAGAYLSVGQLLLLILFVIFGHLGTGSLNQAVAVIMGGGPLASAFWVWAVTIGLVLPTLILFAGTARQISSQGALLKTVGVVAPLLLLLGAFVLRYVFVVAGQITGPVGL